MTAMLSSPIVEPLNGWEAFGAAWIDLYIHLFIVVVIASVIAVLAIVADWLAGSPPGDADTEGNDAGNDESITLSMRTRNELTDYFLYCAAFAMFGFVTAYFLALGLNAERHASENNLIATFATPFISLLTGGVAYVASRTHSLVVRNQLILGVLAFLLTCVFSYQTFVEKEFGLKGEPPATFAPIGGPPGLMIDPPVDAKPPEDEDVRAVLPPPHSQTPEQPGSTESRPNEGASGEDVP